MARTYQFVFDLDNSKTDVSFVVDIDAPSEGDAVLIMRALAEAMNESEDPFTIDVGEVAYARFWVGIDPKKIAAEDIADSWGD